MAEKWHLYMDEAGSFEGHAKQVRGSLLFGLLVPEQEKNELSSFFKDLAGIGSQDIDDPSALFERLHAYKFFQRGKNRTFAESIVDRTINSSMIPFVTQYEQDIYSKMPEGIKEAFTANRYLSMAQTVIEHIIFLHPAFLGRHCEFSLHPNSRICYIKSGQEQLLKRFEDMGFHKRDTEEGDHIVFVWDADVLRAYLHRMAMQYAPWEAKVGRRSWGGIETPVAKNSADPFVHWVDHLAYIYSSSKFDDLKKKLKESIEIDLTYDIDQQTYVYLVRLFLDNRLSDFLPNALESWGFFKKPYYRASIDTLIQNSLKNITLNDLDNICRIEAQANGYLRKARGNWQLVSMLVTRMIDAVNSLTDRERQDKRIQRILSRLYSHKLSWHNHRGEVRQAWEASRAIDALDTGPLTIEDWRADIEIRNRQSVTSANMFAFEQGNKKIQKPIEVLQNMREWIALETGQQVSDQLIGKLGGTMAQNLAFLAPRQPSLFDKAEELFLKAKEEFQKESDLLRQNIYLFHLYMDWAKINADKREKAAQRLKEIERDQGFQSFIKLPDTKTALYQQFSLQALLKWHLRSGNKDKWKMLLGKYSIKSLDAWFGQTANEHPFELIFAYLGLMAMRLNKKNKAKEYFSRKLMIPSKGQRKDHPTLQTIRCLILTWWAMELEKSGNSQTAGQKMEAVVDVLKWIGQQSDLAPILELHGDVATGGWFANAWNRLKTVNWSKTFDHDACQDMVDCFTFNYH